MQCDSIKRQMDFSNCSKDWNLPQSAVCRGSTCQVYKHLPYPDLYAFDYFMHRKLVAFDTVLIMWGYALTSLEQQREPFWQPSGTRFRIENVVVQCLCKADHSHYKPEEGANWSIMNPLYSHGIAWHMVNKVIYCHIPIKNVMSTNVEQVLTPRGYCRSDLDCERQRHSPLMDLPKKTEQMMANRHVHSGDKMVQF